MAEEITNYHKPFMVIPPAQLILGELNALRQQASRLRKKESLDENKKKQEVVKQRLISLGRQDLIDYKY